MNYDFGKNKIWGFSHYCFKNVPNYDLSIVSY